MLVHPVSDQTIIRYPIVGGIWPLHFQSLPRDAPRRGTSWAVRIDRGFIELLSGGWCWLCDWLSGDDFHGRRLLFTAISMAIIQLCSAVIRNVDSKSGRIKALEGIWILVETYHVLVRLHLCVEIGDHLLTQSLVGREGVPHGDFVVHKLPVRGRTCARIEL